MEIDQALVNEEGKIGVIYSKSDAGEYTAQIYENGKQILIEDWSHDAKHFGSLDEAKTELKRNGVSKAYVALDNTYDEFGSLDQEDHQSSNKSRHDFMPISLD